jgi:hypothetical protein
VSPLAAKRKNPGAAAAGAKLSRDLTNRGASFLAQFDAISGQVVSVTTFELASILWPVGNKRRQPESKIPRFGLDR